MTIPKKDPLEKCNLQQACEWLLYGWKPYDPHHEDDFMDKVRQEFPFESKSYKQKAVVLISALLQGGVFLYTIDDNGKYNQIDLKQDTKNRNLLTVTLSNSSGSISILNTIYPMGVYFDFAELEKVFPNGEYETNEGMVKPNKNPLGHKVSYNNNRIFLHKPNETKRLIWKTDGIKWEIIKFVMDNPGIKISRRRLQEELPQYAKKLENYRLDTVLKDMLSETVLDKTDIDILKSFFSYTYGKFIFNNN